MNAGYISGSSYAVKFAAGYTNRLVIDPGATFNGTVTGGNPIGNGKASTLELGSGASAGTLSGIGSQFVDFIGVDVDSGADWVLTGANKIAAESILVNSGTLTDAGTLINYGILLDSGTLIVAGTLAAGAGAAGDVALFGNLLGTLVVERHHRARSLHRHAEQTDWRRQRGNRRR